MQGASMAMAGYVLDMPTKMDNYLGIMARAKETSAIIDVVQRYLAGWSKERIANVQKIDAGWAPFDVSKQPVQVNGTLDVRCIRDAIHCHCMALREANMALTLELLELDEFFFLASEMIENIGRIPLQVRTPAIPSHRDVSAGW
jgi:hypothetical protein